MVIAAHANANASVEADAMSDANANARSDINAKYNVNIYDILAKGDSKEVTRGSTVTSSSSYTSGTLSPPPEFLKSPTPSVIKKLKSSLKLSKLHSTSSVTTNSSATSSQKNVRFAAELTTVKKFDSSAEPMSISNENSPTLPALLSRSDFYFGTGVNNSDLCYEEDIYTDYNEYCDDNDDPDDGFWFNQLPTLKKLSKAPGAKKRSRSSSSSNNHRSFTNFKLNTDYYDSDSACDDNSEADSDNDAGEEDDEEDNICDYDDFDHPIHHNEESPCSEDGSNARIFEVFDWQLLSSNVSSLKSRVYNPFISTANFNSSSGNTEDQIFEFLQGSNIRLHSLKQSKEENGKIYGLIYVNNLNFEKFIEIKFTFNYWKDIHYITAFYSKSITNRIDEFKFVIDMNSLKYSLKVKDLIFAKKNSSTTVCPLNVELCCRYDVNNETFYDNNNYDNYQMKLIATTRPIVPIVASNKPSEVESELAISKTTTTSLDNNKNDKVSSFARNFLVSTTLSHNHAQLASSSSDSRRFNDDTDYYNTSPLKHLYHNDTSLIKPVRLNQVLINPDFESTDEDETIYALPTTDENKEQKKININSDDRKDSFSSDSLMDLRSGSLLSLDSCLNSSATPSLTSSSSSGCSPLEDFNSSDYYPSSSYESFSSIDLAHYNHLPPLTHLDPTMTGTHNCDNSTNNFLSNNYSNTTIIGNYHGDLYDDRQSIITDIVDQNPNINNSTETLTNPNIRPLSSASTESAHTQDGPRITVATSNFLQRTTNFSDETNQNDSFLPPLSSNLKRTKDIDYQSFLSSYCFYSSPTKKAFENGKYASTSMLPLDSSPHRRTLPLNICRENNNTYLSGNDHIDTDNNNNPHDSLLFPSSKLDSFSTSPPILSQGTHWSL